MTEGHPGSRWWLHILLFVATMITTTAQGASYVHGGPFWPLADGLSYSIPLMAILVCHELGHYFAARWHGVPASLPYFIPLPPKLGLLGTMGAVILQSATHDRKKLMDIGAAGPLAGLAVTIPVLLYGLSLSDVKPLVGFGLQEGNSLLYAIFKYLVKGSWLPSEGRDVMLHPTAWAGWAGLFITMLNLLPIAQLDGGHIATAYFGNGYARAARALHRSLPIIGLMVFAWVYIAAQRELTGNGFTEETVSALTIAIQPAMLWIVWFVLLSLMLRMSRGEYHPPVDEEPLPRNRVALFWVICMTFLLIFMPVPLRISVGSADTNSGSTTSVTLP